MDSDLCTIYCGSLSPKVTEEILHELFLQAGPLKCVKIPKTPQGESKLFGFVEYQHECSVDYAIQLFHHTTLFGQELQLKRRKPNNPERLSHQCLPIFALMLKAYQKQIPTLFQPYFTDNTKIHLWHHITAQFVQKRGIKIHLPHQIRILSTIKEDMIITTMRSAKVSKMNVNFDQVIFEKVDDIKEVTTDRVEQIIWKFIKTVNVTVGMIISGADLTTMMGINIADLVAIDLIIKIGITITIKQHDLFQ
ncbi:hypothetical protein DAPPUDRAFT_323316 [Daphnia pulex]|uniref:RRM domain-containing protein n=1 Tax=Daphnia pulex TaxID=6669 RepID=E9GYJ0_DAPPU|nr:hypothetical protein DAPPUDRAFT_323316 [Daphnia pulex]|eukprot:EFX75402.1 hypothetical protein DAPPUDRAFT_323316 [Daphnia pulex]